MAGKPCDGGHLDKNPPGCHTAFRQVDVKVRVCRDNGRSEGLKGSFSHDVYTLLRMG